MRHIRDLYICDNLPVLRGLNSNIVDLIYLDPPFNSRKLYAAPIGSEAEGQMFDDTWRWNDLDESWLGEIDRRCPALAKVIDAGRAIQSDGTAAYLAMMGIRLIELHRVLKPGGSIYLHCDDAATHLLRACMDAVFRPANFRNEIVWRRYGSHNDTRRFGRITERLHYYAGKGRTWNPPLLPLSAEAIDRDYRHRDSRGRYTTSPLQARTLSGGGYRYEWRGMTETWKFPPGRLDQMDAQGLIHWPARGRVPRRKVYLSDVPGKPLPDLMTDVAFAGGSERTGWRTQKPLALLQRIVRASSNRGDLVLDPFCGCATACVAAEVEGRQWIGIDACEAAEDITRVRLSDMATDWSDELLHVSRRPPERTDAEAPSDAVRRGRIADRIKDALYGLQHGDCNGCGNHYRLKDMDIDPIHLLALGGSTDPSNLQLLCGHCNSVKGSGTMEDLHQRLRDRRTQLKRRRRKLFQEIG